MQALT